MFVSFSKTVEYEKKWEKEEIESERKEGSMEEREGGDGMKGRVGKERVEWGSQKGGEEGI